MAIRNQILVSADNVYWTSLKQPLVGYGQRDPRNFLKWMTDRYAQFTETVRETTNQHMDVPWTMGPFEVVVNQIDHGATLYLPEVLSDQIKCDKLYTIAKQSGHLSQACKKWHLRPLIKKRGSIAPPSSKPKPTIWNMTTPRLLLATPPTSSPRQPWLMQPVSFVT